jgi:16S rRNA (guanine(966)-N(2))-methyltransferase RsmD
MPQPKRTQVRVVAGTLKNRRITCVVTEALRPTPQMVREALFSILGDAIPDRPFYDIFAGTGVVGLEAISRGASSAIFLERDVRFAGAIDNYLSQFHVADRGQVVRADVYRWAERWQPRADTPLNVFLSPPFADLQSRRADFLALVATLQAKVPVGSVLVIQGETGFPEGELPAAGTWERRQYGRNLLLIWIRLS